MIPSRYGIYCLLALIPQALLASYSDAALWLLAIVCAVLVLWSVVEFGLLKQQSRKLVINRQVAGSWSLGVPARVSMEVHNNSARRCRLECYDLHPGMFESEGLPQSIVLQAQQRGKLSYRITPTQRGDHQLHGVACRLTQWLWQYQYTAPLVNNVRVYPNFAAQKHFNRLAGASLQTQLGTEKRRQRGGGSDFHQLREFRDGDPLRAIDWKATSRLKKIIAKEYQDERDQQIVVLLDCGRRMAHSDGRLSHLDETLNAVMLLSHIAVRQGDAVGLMTFGGVDRWIAPIKGHTASQQLLKQLYDLRPTREAPDFLGAANLLMQRMRKRALVIIVTNTRNDEQQALTEAITLMRKRHLVLMADLQESVVGDLLVQPVTDSDSAHAWLGACGYQALRDQFHNRLRGHGALILDTAPALLTGHLINRYQQIKNLGSL
jgi:uncharacterized protein (DUF58 family)